LITSTHKIDIQQFERFYTQLHAEYPQVKGSNYDNETKTLIIFYDESELPLTDHNINNIVLPEILVFKKAPLKIDGHIIKHLSSTELVIESFDPENARKAVKTSFPDFEECIPQNTVSVAAEKKKERSK